MVEWRQQCVIVATGPRSLQKYYKIWPWLKTYCGITKNGQFSNLVAFWRWACSFDQSPVTKILKTLNVQMLTHFSHDCSPLAKITKLCTRLNPTYWWLSIYYHYHLKLWHKWQHFNVAEVFAHMLLRCELTTSSLLTRWFSVLFHATSILEFGVASNSARNQWCAPATLSMLPPMLYMAWKEHMESVCEQRRRHQLPRVLAKRLLLRLNSTSKYPLIS